MLSLNQRSQSEKAIYHMVPNIQHSGKGKTMEIVKESLVARSLGEGGRIIRGFLGQ